MYIFGHLQCHTTHHSIYDYMANHWRERFLQLPSYQAFNRRVNELESRFELLIGKQLMSAGVDIEASAGPLIDSLPVMLAVGARANGAERIVSTRLMINLPLPVYG